MALVQIETSSTGDWSFAKSLLGSAGMKQKVIKSIHGLINAGGLALLGAQEVGEAAGLASGTAAALERELKEFIAAHGAAEKANITLGECGVALAKAKEVAFAFATESRDFAKRTLGYSHSEIWVSVGYPKSLKVPKSAPQLIPLLETTVLFLKNHPEQEVAARGITMAQGREVLKALIAARNGYTDAKTELMKARRVRREKSRQLKRRLSFMVSQLKFTLGPLHEYWMRFGFNQPGAKSVPEAPKNVQVEWVDEETAKVTWDPAPGAERYRVDVVEIVVEGSADAVPADKMSLVLHPDERAMVPAAGLPDSVNAGHQTVMREECDWIFKIQRGRGKLEVRVSSLNQAGQSRLVVAEVPSSPSAGVGS